MQKTEFIKHINEAIENKSFAKLVISVPRSKSSELKKITIRLIEIKSESKLSFNYTNQTNDITKNFDLDNYETEVFNYLGNSFRNGVLLTTEADYRLSYSKKMVARLEKTKATITDTKSKTHDKKKNRFVQTKNNEYLKSLGVITEKHVVAPNMHDKFKQINKYVETIDGIIKASSLKNKKLLRIVDMGSGKGYLTFAVYDYLVNTLKVEASVTGVEMREDLVNICNDIAKDCKFDGLNFSTGSIENYQTEKVDILIALHACDTATDDAIYKGISSNAEIIITAPCCHKQIRKQFDVKNELQEVVKFGILEERQAEIVTDTIRSLMLEANQYKTQVFEFIADAHTHKNVMIVGTKSDKKSDSKKYLDKIDSLKSVFGVKYHYLENLLKK